MAFSLKHHFQSLKADGGDATKVQPSNWNAEHDLVMSGPALIGRTTAGSGPAAELSLSLFQLPPGLMCAYALAALPAGWLACDGATVSRATYPELNALMSAESYKYGNGNGTTTFTLPDLRGRVPVMLDATGTRVTATTFTPNGNTLGATGGQQTEAAAVSGGINGVAFTNGVLVGAVVQTAGYLAGDGANVCAGPGSGVGGNVIQDATVTGTFSGSSATVTNVQPSLMTNWIIKVS